MKMMKRILSMLMAVIMILSCWVWIAPEQSIASAANETLKNRYLFAYFTGTSKDGQTIHLAVSEDGYNYTALRNNEPVIIPSKGVGNVRDPYIWYNEQDNYYYILATDLDFTDGGSEWEDYSNNSQSFIVWRSKDLVNWYDETFIDVSKMAHLIGDTRSMTQVWAPQVLWDGSSYVVYFTLCCDATGADGTGWNNMQLVYLKTTDIMDQNAYYEYGVLFDPNYHVIDADIIQNPADGLYYLFYKNEDWEYDTPTTDLKTIHYLVSENACGPYSTTNPQTGASIDTNGDGRGYRVYPNTTVSLEGCNSYFDNEGSLITYTDEYNYKNSLGESVAHFHISKSTDFKTFTMLDDSIHNINSLSPRHGSVVKITEDEYNRLLNNSYNITSSSYSDTETLEDHLVAQYFTTEDGLWNNVIGQPNLDGTQSNINMQYSNVYGWYADFNGTSNYATVDFDSLFLKTNGLNYHDGFTITFSAWNLPMESSNSENNDRIYEIANVFADQSSSTAYYTHFSPSGGGNGSYLGNYNGPVAAGSKDWLNDKDYSNRDDNCMHDYIISYATGNVMVYVDGELVISKNRFNASSNPQDSNDAPLDASWYEALGSNATMLIGKSGFRTEYGWTADDPLFYGRMQNLCIYDCSMSYYDATSMTDSYKEDLGWVEAENYAGITSVVPTFQNTDAARMQSIPNASEHFSNILYTSETVKNYDGNNMSSDSAVWYYNNNDFYYALYYPETTVLLLDGVNDAIMPISFGAYCTNTKKTWKTFYQVYPTTGPGSTADLGELEISQNWGGWYNNGDYYECVVSHADGYIGRNSTTTSYSSITSDKNYDCHWGAPLKVNENSIDFGDSYYKKFNLTWQVNVCDSSENYAHLSDHSTNMTSDNDIYVINFKPVLDLRNSITEAEYNEIMNNSSLCPELKTKYAAAVYEIRTINPNNFGFAEAPITATKACATAIGEAISTYEGVMAEIAREEAAGNYGHQPTAFEAREATCAVNGLTTGSYCVLCGEVLEEQETIATLPHTFGEVYTENGIQYRKCTVCGVKLEYKPYEVRYENLFSLNRWYDSDSDISPQGTSVATISTDLINGQIKIVNSNTGSNPEVYTSGTYDGQNLVATRNFNNDCIPVTGGQSYVVEATSLASSTSNGDVFVFQYNKDGLAFSAIPACISGLTPGETRSLEFTVDANAAYIELRFDANDEGKTITFSQIGVYEKEEFDKFGKDTADARLGYYPGDNKALCYPNPSAGYSFDGWYTSSGVKIENVNQLNTSTNIVYGKWIPAGFDVTYDSIFSFSEWAKSSSIQLWYGDVYKLNTDGSRGTFESRLVSYEGIIADAEKGTISITWDADNKTYADTENGKYIQYGARTNYWVDQENLYQMTVERNTDYIIEYTATSDDGAKSNVCAYLTGGTASYPESGAITKNGLGTQYFRISTGDNTKLTLRFDNVQIGSTITYSNIAVYRADKFLDHAQNITNREYRRYYPTEMGIGNLFEYIPERPGFTFINWYADVDDTVDGNATYACTELPDDFVVADNWHLFSAWNENSYTIAYDANGGTGTVASQPQKYTADVTLASSGFTKTGYTLIGWSTVPNATSALYKLGQTTNRLCGDLNGTITLYAVWQANRINITFDNLIDFKAWNKVAGNGTVSDVKDTGFTITCNEGADEATSSSPYFTVEPGKSYKVDMDITGDGWDVYVFFCDTNGAWIDFKDGTNRYSSGGSGNSSQIFTAPNKSEVVKAQIRVDSNGAGNVVRFENIRVYEANDITYYGVPNTYATYDSAYPSTSAGAYKEGYDFLGWYDGTLKYYDADGNPVSTASFTHVNTLALTSKWQINNDALVVDNIVLDFDKPVTFNPFDNDTILLESGYNYNLIGLAANEEAESGAATLNGTYGSFTADATSRNVTYTPSKVLDGIDTVYYVIKVADGTIIVGAINIVPASNVLYEEDNFTTTNTTGEEWKTEGTAGATSQTTESDIYGYDTVYNNNVTDYSNGSALKTTVTSTNKRAQIKSFTFNGTGYDLYGQCGPNTGVMIVTIKDSTGKAIKASVIDTYYNDAFGTLTQVPITGASDLAYDEYTVQVSSMYLASAGAVKATQTQSVMGFGDMVAYSAPLTGAQMLYEALAEVGMEDVFEADDLEVIWFDDDSVFNGGYGAYTLADAQSASTSTASAVTELTCVIDSIRVYNPAYYVGDDYYISSETGAQYYNIIDNLVSGDVVTGNALFTFVSGETNESVDKAAYQDKGSKNEFYLINDSTANALSFTIDPATLANKENAKIMISLRAASGTPKASINGNAFDVSSATEMYYDITEYVDANTGVVAIQNIGDGLLAIDNIKLTGNAAVSTFNLFATRRMMAMPVEEVEPNAPEETPSEPEIEDVPSVDEENTTPDADTSTDTSTATDEDSAINGLLDFINKLIEFILKIVRTIFAIFSI